MWRWRIIWLSRLIRNPFRALSERNFYTIDIRYSVLPLEKNCPQGFEAWKFLDLWESRQRAFTKLKTNWFRFILPMGQRHGWINSGAIRKKNNRHSKYYNNTALLYCTLNTQREIRPSLRYMVRRSYLVYFSFRSPSF